MVCMVPKKRSHMQYMFSKKNWCLGALLISTLYYSHRTLLMYLKLCLLRALFLLCAGDRSGMLLNMAFLNHHGVSEHLDHVKSCFGL